MAKKNFDRFLDTVRVPKPTVSEIDAMTREIHQLSKPAPVVVENEPVSATEKGEKGEAELSQKPKKAAAETANLQPKKAPKTVLIPKKAVPEKAEKTAAAPAFSAEKEPGKRGRKPNPPEAERLIRVSVDLPESLIIELKGRVTRERTDMKNFIRQLVEQEMSK